MSLKYIGDCSTMISYLRPPVRNFKVYTYTHTHTVPDAWADSHTSPKYLYHMLESARQHLALTRHSIDTEARQKRLETKNWTSLCPASWHKGAIASSIETWLCKSLSDNAFASNTQNDDETLQNWKFLSNRTACCVCHFFVYLEAHTLASACSLVASSVRRIVACFI